MHLRLFALIFLGMTALTERSISAGPLSVLLDKGGDDGKIATFAFRLRDSFFDTSIAWSPDGRYIASASTFGNEIHIWDLTSRAIIRKLPGYANGYYHNLSWSPDGRFIAACSYGRLLIFETATWQKLGEPLDNPQGLCLYAVAFSSDGRQLASLGVDLTVLSTDDWHVIKVSKIDGGWGRVRSVKLIDYIPGTYTLLIGGGEIRNVNVFGRQDRSHDGTVWLLKSEETVPTRSIQVYRAAGENGGNGPAIRMAISPDGKMIVTGARTGSGSPGFIVTESVHIAQLSEGTLLGAPLDGQDFGFQEGLAFMPDGRFIIVAHANDFKRSRSIHIIDATTFQVVDTVHGGAVSYDVTVHGKQFAAGSDKEILIWDLP